jgi:hypothetical protein
MWGQATHTASSYFRNAMYQSHPELRLCDNHWKLDYLAHKDYPSWIRPSRKPQKIMSKEVTGKHTIPALMSQKHTHDDDGVKTRKKPKPDAQVVKPATPDYSALSELPDTLPKHTDTQ